MADFNGVQRNDDGLTMILDDHPNGALARHVAARLLT